MTDVQLSQLCKTLFLQLAELKNVLLWHPVLLNPHLLELSSFRDQDGVSLNEIQESNFCVGHVHDSNNDA